MNIEGRPRPAKLTNESAIYGNPVWSYSSNRIVFTRGTAQNYKNAIGPRAFQATEDLCWISSDGGVVNFIDKTRGRRNPHFVKGNDRIYLNHTQRGLLSIRWDGTDEKEHVKVKGITTYGAVRPVDEAWHTSQLLPQDFDDAMERDQPSNASMILMAPTGDKALAAINNDIYTVTVPIVGGETPTVSVANIKNSQFPSRKLTEMGGQFPVWSLDAKKIHWSIGNGHFVYDMDDAKAYEDSVKSAKKAEKEKKEAEKDKNQNELKEEFREFRERRRF